MKKLLTLITASALAFLGTTVETEANPHYGYHAPASTVYVSGYRYGRPVYTEKYFVGYDRYGRPVFRYRTYQPRRGYSVPCHYDGYSAYQPRYSNSQYHHYGSRHSSGTRVTFSFGR